MRYLLWFPGNRYAIKEKCKGGKGEGVRKLSVSRAEGPCSLKAVRRGGRRREVKVGGDEQRGEGGRRGKTVAGGQA